MPRVFIARVADTPTELFWASLLTSSCRWHPCRVEELPETPSVTGDLRRDRPIPGAIKWKASQPRLNSRSGSHSSLSDGRQSAPPQFVRMSEAVAGEV